MRLEVDNNGLWEGRRFVAEIYDMDDAHHIVACVNAFADYTPGWFQVDEEVPEGGLHVEVMMNGFGTTNLRAYAYYMDGAWFSVLCSCLLRNVTRWRHIRPELAQE
jgi:tartrate dehydratase alpha subunit/fumarate hydratase class I-like protein